MKVKHIIIDTEDYAGNFERPMVAYITGQLGDCGVGEGSQLEALAELPEDIREWFDDNVEEHSDNGCYRPAKIAITPLWANDGKGNFSKVSADDPTGFPAYLSVAFVVSEWPPDNIIACILERARSFCEKRSITYVRVRFATVESVTTTVRAL